MHDRNQTFIFLNLTCEYSHSSTTTTTTNTILISCRCTLPVSNNTLWTLFITFIQNMNNLFKASTGFQSLPGKSPFGAIYYINKRQRPRSSILYGGPSLMEDIKRTESFESSRFNTPSECSLYISSKRVCIIHKKNWAALGGLNGFRCGSGAMFPMCRYGSCQKCYVHQFCPMFL